MRYIPLFAAIVAAVTVFGGENDPVDRYGQVIDQKWPGKVESDDRLRADAAEEAPLLTKTAPDSAEFDRFGGRLSAGKFEARGRFHLKKIDGVWWLITPEGHRYFAIGCDAVDPGESGYATMSQTGDKQPRRVLTEMPSPEEFPDAYLYRGAKVSFLLANLQRKYGPDYREKVRDVNRRRLLAWGFNSTAKWGWEATFGMPFIHDIVLKSVRRFDRYTDMFDPEFPAKAEAEVAAQAAKWAADPMLIAFSVDNENGWCMDALLILSAETPDFPAKIALIDFYIGKLGEANAAALFGVSGLGRQGMLDNRKQIRLTGPEAGEFIRTASRKYHEIMRGIYKRLAPDTLWFGAAHCTGQAREWIEEAAKHVDALQFNEYAVDAGWSTPLLEICKKEDKPFFVTEYSMVCVRRGYSFYQVMNTMKDDAARGLGYRHYAEKQAASPYCIGLGWFIFYDQPTTLRQHGGEGYNFGLVNQQDQPYEPMLAEVKKTNANLEAVHAGELAPFALKDPVLSLDTSAKNSYTPTFLPGTTSPYINIDRSRPAWFAGLAERLTIMDKLNPAPGFYPVGVIECPAGEKRTPYFRIFLWSERRDRDQNRYFKLEGSSDGTNFSPLEARFRMVAPRIHDEYEMTAAAPLPDEIKFLRFSLGCPEPRISWCCQYGGVSWTKPVHDANVCAATAPGAAGANAPRPEFLPGTASPIIIADRSNPQRFGGEPLRIKINERLTPEKGFHVAGVIPRPNSAPRTPVFKVFLWKGRRGGDLNRFFRLETSTDGNKFDPADAAFTPVKEGEHFDEYTMTPAAALPDEVKFVRILLGCPEPPFAWSNQYAGVSWK